MTAVILPDFPSFGYAAHAREPGPQPLSILFFKFSYFKFVNIEYAGALSPFMSSNSVELKLGSWTQYLELIT